jgi:hypothetical protein
MSASLSLERGSNFCFQFRKILIMEACTFLRFFTGCQLTRTGLFSGMICILLILMSGRALAQLTEIELSPLVARSTLIGPVEGNKQISVVLAAPLSDPDGAAEFIRQVSTRGSPLYHQYLTPQEFAERFGGNATDYLALKDWAVANGLQISQESIGRLTLTVRGTAAQLEAIFKTQLNIYRLSDGNEFYSAGIKPTVPDAIASKISGVIGLTVGKQYAPLLKVGKVLGESPLLRSAADNNNPDGAGGTGPGGTYAAKD